jgi:hypothetical protein
MKITLAIFRLDGFSVAHEKGLDARSHGAQVRARRPAAGRPGPVARSGGFIAMKCRGRRRAEECRRARPRSPRWTGRRMPGRSRSRRPLHDVQIPSRVSSRRSFDGRITPWALTAKPMMMCRTPASCSARSSGSGFRTFVMSSDGGARTPQRAGDGKQGVAGSSPAEGSSKRPFMQGLCVERLSSGDDAIALVGRIWVARRMR